MRIQVSEQILATIKDAVGKLTGRNKRTFQAQVALDYFEGSARHAESVLGWGRDAVAIGIQELQGSPDGATAQDSPPDTRGRPKTVKKLPRLEEDIRSLVDPQSQVDPKFQSSFAYTRMTAKNVRQSLIDLKGYSSAELPNVRTMRRILNGLDYRLQRVQKSKPLKKIKETDAIFENVHRANREADEDPTCIRISLDSKAKLKIGELSRGGKSREKKKLSIMTCKPTPRWFLLVFWRC